MGRKKRELENWEIKEYKISRKVNKFIRGKVESKVTKDLNGVTEQIFGNRINKEAYNNAGKYYKKGTNPSQGSAYYTIFHIWAVIKYTLILLLIAGFVINFFRQDILTQLKTLVGLVPLILIICGIVKVVGWFKKKFK